MSDLVLGGPAHKLQAVDDNAAGQPDPNAVTTWEETDSTGATPATSGFITLTDNHDGTATVEPVALGDAFVVAIATDPDGNVVRSLPFAVSVTPNTDTTTVTVTDLGAV